MSFGLNIYNTQGDIQIDQDFSCYEIVEKGHHAGRNNSGEIDFGGVGDSLLFVRPVTNGNLLGRGKISDISTTFLYVAGNDEGWFYSSASGRYSGRPADNWQGIDYLIARPSSHRPSQAEGMGLQVFTETGDAAFDSNREYLKIKAVLRTSAEGTGVESFTLPPPAPGKKYYVCALQLYFDYVSVYRLGDEEYYGPSVGFSADNIFKVRKRQELHHWPGAIDRSPGDWEISSLMRPFWIIAEH